MIDNRELVNFGAEVAYKRAVNDFWEAIKKEEKNGFVISYDMCFSIWKELVDKKLPPLLDNK